MNCRLAGNSSQDYNPTYETGHALGWVSQSRIPIAVPTLHPTCNRAADRVSYDRNACNPTHEFQVGLCIKRFETNEVYTPAYGDTDRWAISRSSYVARRGREDASKCDEKVREWRLYSSNGRRLACLGWAGLAVAWLGWLGGLGGLLGLGWACGTIQ